MKQFSEVTAETLKNIRGLENMTQEDVAQILGVQINAISKIESGGRALSGAEKKLLDLYFFGTMPEGVIRKTQDLGKTLDFTEDEWNMIRIIAQRAGQPPEAWIRSQILTYLAFHEKTSGQQAQQPQPQNILPLAAEDPANYRSSNKGA